MRFPRINAFARDRATFQQWLAIVISRGGVSTKMIECKHGVSLHRVVTRPIDSERKEGEGAGLKSWREGKGRVGPLANQLPEETKAHQAVVIDQKGVPEAEQQLSHPYPSPTFRNCTRT
mgnify:CR=1 FL=1